MPWAILNWSVMRIQVCGDAVPNRTGSGMRAHLSTSFHRYDILDIAFWYKCLRHTKVQLRMGTHAHTQTHTLCWCRCIFMAMAKCGTTYQGTAVKVPKGHRSVGRHVGQCSRKGVWAVYVYVGWGLLGALYMGRSIWGLCSVLNRFVWRLNVAFAVCPCPKGTRTQSYALSLSSAAFR